MLFHGEILFNSERIWGRYGGFAPVEGVAEIPERRGSDQACLGISA